MTDLGTWALRLHSIQMERPKAPRPAPKISDHKKRRIKQLVKAGWGLQRIADHLRINIKTVRRWR